MLIFLSESIYYYKIFSLISMTTKKNLPTAPYIAHLKIATSSMLLTTNDKFPSVEIQLLKITILTLDPVLLKD